MVSQSLGWLLPALALLLFGLPACNDSALSLIDGDREAGEQDRTGDGDLTEEGDAPPDGDAAEAGEPEADPDPDSESEPDPDPDPDPEPDRPDGDQDASGPWTEPYQAGPWGVVERAVQMNVSGTGGTVPRTITVDICLPDDEADAPYPTVILNHGFQYEGSYYLEYCRRLAGHGIVTLVPTWGDGMTNPITHARLAEYTSSLIDWAIIQARTPGSPLLWMVDETRIGAGGHSRGGKQSILAAINDTRIRASFNLDPVDAGPPFGSNPVDYPSVAPELMPGFRIPGGFTGAGKGGEGFQPCAPEAENYRQYYQAAGSPAFEYLIPAAGHLDFMDSCGMFCIACAAGSDQPWTHTFALATQTAFYKLFLAGDERYRPWVEGNPVTSLADRVTFSRK